MNSERVEGLFVWGRILIIVLVIFVAALAINTMKAIWQPTYPVNQISVTGEGEAFAIPDIAHFSASVIEEAETVDEAQTESAEKVNAIIEYLKDEGVEEKDIKTEYYNVYPKYEYQNSIRPTGDMVYYPEPTNQVLVGYEVNQTLTVKVRDVEKAGALLSGVGELGASNISGISFTVDDEEAVKDEARALAIADARSKAKELSKSLGVRLGKVISFYEDSGYPVYYEGYGGGGFDKAVSVSEAVPPEVPVGENKTTVHVTVSYEIR